MKLSTFRRLNRQDFPSLPEEMDPFLEALNSVLEEHTKALQGRLAFEENVQGEIWDLDLSSGVELEITLRELKSKPLGVLLVWADTTAAATLSWRVMGRLTIGVTVTFSPAPSEPVTVRLVLLGDLEG